VAGKFHWVADYTLEEQKDYVTHVHTFESGKEQRRLKHANPQKKWTLSFPNIVLTQATDMESFFKLQHGSELTFTWINPIDNVQYTVRFLEDAFSIKRVTDNVYNIEVGLIEII